MPERPYNHLKNSVERLTGYSSDYLKSTPLAELRKYAEMRHGRHTRVTGVRTRVVSALGCHVRILEDFVA